MVNTFTLVLVALNAFLIITKMIKSFTRLHDLSNHYTFTELMDCPPSEGSFFKYVQPVKSPYPYVWTKIDDFEITSQLGLFGYSNYELQEVAHYFPVDEKL